MVKSEISNFFVRKLILKMKFVHTVEICLKNATTVESFVEYSQEVVQKWPFSPIPGILSK
jgi:hypothetical protein